MGESLDVPKSTFQQLEKFVCNMYGKSKYISVNKLRYAMFTQKFKPKPGHLLSSSDGVDLSLLPPSKDSLRIHIIRANSKVCNPGIPSPDGHGRVLNEHEHLVYEWTKEEIMPQQLIDIICKPEEDEEGDSSTEDDNDEIEIDNMIDIMFEDSDDE